MFHRTYTFHYQNIKYSYQYFFLLLGGIIGFCVFLVGWTDLVFLIPWYVYLVLFALWILGLRRNFKKIKTEKEDITLTPEGFQSTLFGSVDFDDIQSYHISLLQAKINTQHPVPTLVIKLIYGQTIRFNLSVKHEKQDFSIFFDFVVRFVELMKNRDTEAYQKAQEKLDQYEVVVQHPKRYWKRMAGWSTAVLVIGLALNQFIQSHPELFTRDDVREMQTHANADFAQQKRRLRRAIRKEGAVYVLSNDTTIEVRLMPNMEKPKAHYPGGPMLKKVDIAEKIKRFLAQKDSLGFHTTIHYKENFIDQIPKIPIKNTPGMQYLYLTLLSRKGLDTTETPRIINWEIGYRIPDEIAKKLNHSFPSFKTVAVHYLSAYPDSKLFMTASQREGMKREDFQLVADQVMQLLHTNKVDTTHFKVLVFNRKG